MAEAIAQHMLTGKGPSFPGRGISEISRQSALLDKKPESNISNIAQNPNQ